MANPVLRPQITLCETDHRQLLLLAHAAAEANDDLFSEIERARVVNEKRFPSDVVRMGSRVSYRTDAGEEREVTLVYPKQADINQARVSVLTPIGTALIGLRTGQSITWYTRDGQRRTLTVLSVTQPVLEG